MCVCVCVCVCVYVRERERERERETVDPTISQLGWMPRCPANALLFSTAALVDSAKVSNVFSGHGSTTPIKTDLAWTGQIRASLLII